MCRVAVRKLVFFFNDTATTEIYTLSLHDALPICSTSPGWNSRPARRAGPAITSDRRDLLRGSTTRESSIASASPARSGRSEEHTSELQSRQYLVCRLLLVKKQK